MSSNSPVIGIDLGTTFCCVAHYNPRTKIVDIIENGEGQRTTPSYIAFKTNGDVLIGAMAKSKILQPSDYTVVYDSKRLIGQKFDDLQLKKYGLSFKVTATSDGSPLIQVPLSTKTLSYRPEHISAKLLEYIKKIAQDRLDMKVKDAVITVPAYFSFHQRTATMEAAKLAGLRVLRIINEPTAAAIAYVHKNEIGASDKNIVVFDLGGGTLDVSVINVDKDCAISIKATAGNTHLGGRDFDNNLEELILRKIKTQFDKDVTENLKAVRRIRRRYEEVKINLTFETSTQIELISLIDQEDVYIDITRDEFEEINAKLFESCMKVVRSCLEDAKLLPAEIDKIVLIGGSTRIPKLQEMLTQFFGKPLTKAINPDEAVACGAAIQAHRLTDESAEKDYSRVVDVTPLSLGTNLMGGLMEVAIPRNTPIPASFTRKYYTVLDKQKTAEIEIYEGERPLTEFNTKIGTCTIELSPQPPGYSVEVTFNIDVNGVLDVSIKTNSGIYKGIEINYEKQSQLKGKETLQSSKKNKMFDDKKYTTIQNWRNLQNYCSKMDAICNYDTRGLTDQEKDKIRKICDVISEWIYDNEVIDGNETEMETILNFRMTMEAICEPIINKYQYYVKSMSWDEFYALMSNY